MSSSHSQRHPAPIRLPRLPLMVATLLVLTTLAAFTSCIREELPPLSAPARDHRRAGQELF